MEIENNNTEVKQEEIVESRKCTKCGRVLPLTMFGKYASGYRKICKDCSTVSTDKFKDFTSRELIDELKHRGYKGKLAKVVIKEIQL